MAPSRNIPAGQSTLTGGWLQVKKRGRDDAQIEKDKRRALAARIAARKTTKSKPVKEANSDDEFIDDLEDSEGSIDDYVNFDDEKEEFELDSEEESIADSEDCDEGTFLKQFAYAARPSVPSRALARTKQAAQSSHNKSFRNAMKPPAIKKSTPIPTARTGVVVDGGEDDLTPVKQRRGPISSKPIKQQFDESSDDENQRRVSKPYRVDSDESSMDDDERIVLQHVLSQSKRENSTNSTDELLGLYDSSEDDESGAGEKKQQKLAAKKVYKRVPHDAMLQIPRGNQHVDCHDHLEEESSNDEMEPDEEFKEEQKAATSVLHTAEQLSAQVVAAMRQWVGEHDAIDSSHHGLIHEGTVAIGAVREDTLDSPQEKRRHRWISQEVMRHACQGVELAAYQLVGCNWLALLHGMKCSMEGGRETNVNGILADEMGLGKTVQTIAFLAWLKHSRLEMQGDTCNTSRPHLIVVPVSVLANWVREFETFCPDISVVKYHGTQSEREEIQIHLKDLIRRGAGPDVILVPISMFQKEKSDDRRFLMKSFKTFDYLVVDEAHMLKNASSTRYRTLDRVPSAHRLLLTGTPVQNSPSELLNMLCFLMPLFSRGGTQTEQEDRFGDRMLRHFVEELDHEGNEQAAYRKLKQLFAPFVLRRKKENVISQLLPSKNRVVEVVNLDCNGRGVYDSILMAHLKENGASLSPALGEHLFTNLRKAAHHPLLLRNRHTCPEESEKLITLFHKYGAFRGEGSTRARIADEVSKMNDFNIHLTALDLIDENPHRRPELQRYILDEESLFTSAKFIRLRALLPDLVSKGHRVLIFSGWTSCLDLLGCLMENLGLKYLRMDGSSPSQERQHMIDSFNRDNSIQVFLLSTKACGLGINLTAADTCIIHDLDFNPFNDLQAEDRCHRIGQRKPVTVYKLVTADTVDSDIFHMQERKSKMNAAIMESAGDSKRQRQEMVQKAMGRLLASPEGGKGSTKTPFLI